MKNMLFIFLPYFGGYLYFMYNFGWSWTRENNLVQLLNARLLNKKTWCEREILAFCLLVLAEGTKVIDVLKFHLASHI